MPTTTWAPARLTVDEETVFDGEVAVGQDWNGFAIPRFDLQTATAILDDFEGTSGLQYELVGEGSSQHFLVYIEGELDQDIYPDEDGKFAVGAGYWAWQIATVYRPEIAVADGSPEVWYTNAIRGTAEECETAARRTYASWTLASAWRVVPDETPPKQPVLAEHVNRVFLEVPQ